MPVLESALSLLRCRHGQLSSEDVQLLARWLSPDPPCSKQPLRPFPFTEYLCAYARISKKVNAALNTYSLMQNGESYELHTICGVNDNVSGPVGTVAKCYRSHVNFLATQCHAGGTPVLFFAEFSNDDKDGGGTQPFCCPVPLPSPCAERVRCLYCDYMGIRIVHPVGEDFHGRKWEFEKMVCGEDPCNEDFDPALEQLYYTNMNIIDQSRITTERVNGRVKDDRLYDGCVGHESDEYDSGLISSMSDDYDSDMGSMCDEYHVPHKFYHQITCWEP
uniref:DUF3615 domain-containing protein n=1 Tax=Arundo donax TaxID=35708 RepID=A0A0A9B644_ARUDO